MDAPTQNSVTMEELAAATVPTGADVAGAEAYDPARTAARAKPSAREKAPWKKDPPPDPLQGIKTAVLAFLNSQTETVYVLLDAARNERVIRLLREMAVPAGLPDDPRAAVPAERPDACEYQSLYIGKMAAEMAEQGPYLVRLPKQCPLLGSVVREGWGDSWGVFLTSQAPLFELRRQFRRFIMARHPDGNAIFFRFYDPRVLRAFLPPCTKEELNVFFGGVSAFLIETATQTNAARMAFGPAGLLNVFLLHSS